MSDDNAFAIKSERDISAHILTESKMGQDHSTMEWMREKDKEMKAREEEELEKEMREKQEELEKEMKKTQEGLGRETKESGVGSIKEWMESWSPLATRAKEKEKEIKAREEKLKEKQEELEKEMKERERETGRTELHIKGEEQWEKNNAQKRDAWRCAKKN